MDILSNLALGFSIALSPWTLMLAVIGCFIGTIVGALPGLGPSNGVALLIPITFSMGLDATAALVLLTSVYYGAMYGGRISSILLNIPGDEPAMMTTLDGYPMARAGRAGDALVISGVASFVGALFATIALALVAPMLARVAYLFGPAEYFALYLLAFSTLGGIASKNQAKAALASAIGLGIAMIGLDNSSGSPRFTGGNLHLADGVDFLVAIVGLFAVSEVFVFIESHGKGSAIGVKLDRVTIPWRDIWVTRWTMLRSSVLGFIAGVLPGAGASLGSFLTYMMEKSIAGPKGGFGTGVVKGVAAPEAGNNSAAGGALVPMLTLGVPGSGTTAVLLAVLMTLNITPGPTLFANRPDVVWGLIASLLIANFVLLLMNVPLVKIFVKVLSVPANLLLPGVMMVSFVGIYSLTGSYFDLLLMVAFGVMGWLFRKLDIPTVPVILGILLGNAMENNLRQAMTLSNGEWQYLFSSGISITLWSAAVLGFVAPLFLRRIIKRPATPMEAMGEHEGTPPPKQRTD
ncbi:tripartite tricarboxylate transporter permease [Jannaschia rubra]|uniref:tripartite tricarboxylate transporter permease n=1 Tax=Jannaschia rubra TaxID=282197 RepID=UPI002492FFDF|nr:tripartite tricarboxylate transporter permease [Jannaschia rubra]